MNSLDSRFLRYGDTFGQKFSQPGRYSYRFGLSAFGQLAVAGRDFIINVEPIKDNPNNRKARQHDVVVRREDKQLKADPPELTIGVGDVVLWGASDSTIPGFSIGGYSKNDSFHSAALARGAVYTHIFGSPGEFNWEDANGHHVSGTVTVTMPETGSQEELEYYRKRLSEGVLVLIRGQEVEPKRVEISVGQTVFFAVEKADGVTITDHSLR